MMSLRTIIFWRWTTIVFLAGFFGPVRFACGGEETAEVGREIAAMRVLDGFEVQLFASEKDGVVKPIQIRFDPRGRLWVIGSTVYPQIQPGQIPNDKIVVLEDRDGDGKVDHSQVFADGLQIPTGIELGNGGVYVGQGNELLFLKDTDGDGRADERQVLLRGFGTGDAHQTINSFTWSPGGELFMCQGLHAFSRVETPWGLEVLEQAGVWRFEPSRLRLDPFLNQAMGPQNPFGVAFNYWGQPILVAGNGEGIYFLKPGMTRSHERHPLKALWNTGRKFGGADFVENSHWPSAYQGELITGSYLNNAVFRFEVKEEGSGFTVKDLPPLITSTDNRFRVVDVRFGPDGALYLCDWYNPIIGHYQASFRHPGRDKEHGRIWRVTAKGRPTIPRRTVSLAELSIAQLCDELLSAERWTRQMAKRELSTRPVMELLPSMKAWREKLDPTTSLREHALMEGLGVLESVEVVDPAWLQLLLQAREPRVRAYAVSVLGRWSDRLPEALNWLAVAVADPDSRVRLDAAVAASRFQDPRALVEALKLVRRPLDDATEYALQQTVRVLKPLWRDPLRRGSLDLGANFDGLEFLVKADRSPDTSEFVVQRLRDEKVSRDGRVALMNVLAETGDARQLASLLDPATVRSREGSAVPELQAKALASLVHVARSRQLRPEVVSAESLEKTLSQLRSSGDLSVQAESLRLAGAWHWESWRSELASVAQDDGKPLVLRTAAIQALGYLGGTESQDWLARFQSTLPLVQLESLDALASLNPTRAAESAVRLLNGHDEKLGIDRLFTIFLSRRDGPEALRVALAGDRSAITRSTAEAGLRVMTASGRRHDGLHALLTSILGEPTNGHAWTGEEMTRLAVEVKQSGDARRGAQIYGASRLNCVACHAIGGVGGKVGPDLGALGTAQPIEFIIGAILEPQKEIKEGFTAHQITTRSGEDYQGYLVREGPEDVVIRDVLQNQEVVLRRKDIAERRKLGSLMPSGLVDGLSREEFRDLIRFLSDLGRLPQ